MPRTGGPRPTSARCVLAAGVLALVPAAALAACSSDSVKEAALEKLAIGTWACSTDAPGSSSEPFEVQVRKGGFTVTIDGVKDDTKLTGTWAIEDGQLDLDFTGAAAGAPDMHVPGFSDLTVDSTELTLDDGGMTGVPMEVSENDPDAVGAPLDVALDIQGTSSFTWTLPYDGDPWTCERQ